MIPGSPRKFYYLNRLAQQAALQIVLRPTRLGNPVFFLGKNRSGKSEILKWIENFALERGQSVFRISFPHLAQKYRLGLKTKDLDRLQQGLCAAKILLVDELERIATSRHTQEFLITILDQRLLEGKQIVLASRVEPGEIPGMDPRFRNRCQGGFVFSLQNPTPNGDLLPMAKEVAKRFQVLPEDLQGQGGHRAASARAAFVNLACKRGFRPVELAQFLGRKDLNSVSYLKRKSKQLRQENPIFRSHLEALEAHWCP